MFYITYKIIYIDNFYFIRLDDYCYLEIPIKINLTYEKDKQCKHKISR